MADNNDSDYIKWLLREQPNVITLGQSETDYDSQMITLTGFLLVIHFVSDSKPGVCVPPGVCKHATGGTQNLKSPQNEPIPVSYLYIRPDTNGGTQSDRIFFRGYSIE